MLVTQNNQVPVPKKFGRRGKSRTVKIIRHCVRTQVRYCITSVTTVLTNQIFVLAHSGTLQQIPYCTVEKILNPSLNFFSICDREIFLCDLPLTSTVPSKADICNCYISLSNMTMVEMPAGPTRPSSRRRNQTRS